jgi:transposase
LEEAMRVRTRRKYEDGFAEQAVALLERSDRSIAAVASSLGVPQTTLWAWYTREMARRRKAKQGAPPTATATAAAASETVQQKLQRLERENAALKKQVEDLQLDRDILKKAAAFFAKESQ